jgi:hypothetical protein
MVLLLFFRWQPFFLLSRPYGITHSPRVFVLLHYCRCHLGMAADAGLTKNILGIKDFALLCSTLWSNAGLLENGSKSGAYILAKMFIAIVPPLAAATSDGIFITSRVAASEADITGNKRERERFYGKVIQIETLFWPSRPNTAEAERGHSVEAF